MFTRMTKSLNTISDLYKFCYWILCICGVLNTTSCFPVHQIREASTVIRAPVAPLKGTSPRGRTYSDLCYPPSSAPVEFFLQDGGTLARTWGFTYTFWTQIVAKESMFQWKPRVISANLMEKSFIHMKCARDVCVNSHSCYQDHWFQ